MARKRYLPEQIIGYLREVEVLLSKGSKVPQMCRKIGLRSKPITVGARSAVA